MAKMFQKFGLDCTSTHNPPPFETMMNEEQVDALLTGRTLKQSGSGLGCRDSKSFVKKTVNMTSYVTECENSSPALSEYEEGVKTLLMSSRKPVLTGRLARWTVILHQFNNKYVPQKAVKGQALADFLAAHPVPDDSSLMLDLPDEEVMQREIKKGWEMYFDGASKNPDGEKQNDQKNNQSGIGIVFVTQKGGIILHSFSLTEGCSNNEAEYEAIIMELELSLEVSIDDLTIYGDSELIIKQLNGEYQIRKPNILHYYERAYYLFFPNSQSSRSDLFVEREMVGPMLWLASLTL
ncbi:hypothetical protein RJ640_006066 [Escallonia rubra]|uniref:RNase H type-1 domain-containing protein n=1 Tax=Escallonia rubra TaxID=112253 RepID=A0AA88RA08_9ASTE|nr:hypothetical protein RJ640_006066 [Escallonia rubra]